MPGHPSTTPTRILVLTPTRAERRSPRTPALPRLRASLPLRRIEAQPGTLRQAMLAWRRGILDTLNPDRERRDDVRPAA